MKKKVLVILGHPDPVSFNAAIYKTYVKNIDHRNCEVETLELGKLKFDPVLRFGYRKFMQPDADIERSRELIKWADHIVFIYPIWWSSMPSLLKGWLDRVITPGFAYNMKGLRSIKHLTGRTAELIMTGDGPAVYHKLLVRTPITLMKNRILRFCGIRVKKVRICSPVNAPNDKNRTRFLKTIARAARRQH